MNEWMDGWVSVLPLFVSCGDVLLSYNPNHHTECFWLFLIGCSFFFFLFLWWKLLRIDFYLFFHFFNVFSFTFTFWIIQFIFVQSFVCYLGHFWSLQSCWLNVTLFETLWLYLNSYIHYDLSDYCLFHYQNILFCAESWLSSSSNCWIEEHSFWTMKWVYWCHGNKERINKQLNK